ncbi:MAG: NAD(P)-dependent oxidoreductase [Colwellia sp.]|nr:NAD(P)-dependent oxidoreductase [Colwellia sp.]
MKVCILGGLGYIGSALIELYKKESNCKIYLVDKLFIPDRLVNLPENFKYIQADILDKKLMTSLLHDADIVYLLAAACEAEKSIHREELIWKNNYEGALNVIDCCPDTTRILFASSGNLFGGVDEKKKYLNLTEKDEPHPKYPYAESKRGVEKYLLEGKKTFTICRFGTNYGYAPGIRFNLVTNIFIKKALVGENFPVHAQGDNYRPTVHVQDAARGMKFLGTKQEAEGEIYHIVQENYKIKELAENISKYNRKTSVEYIDKEVPFSSYHLNSDKIKELGFEFHWNLDRGISNMFDVFSSMINE